MLKLTPQALLALKPFKTKRTNYKKCPPSSDHSDFRQLLENEENNHACAVIFMNASVGELYALSNISPIVEEKVKIHLDRRRFNRSFFQIAKFLTHHGIYRYVINVGGVKKWWW